MQVLQDGLPVTDITPGSADPYTPGFALVPALSAAPRSSLPGPWLQFMSEGVSVGEANVAIVDLTGDPERIVATRGVGENSHVITMRIIQPPDPFLEDTILLFHYDDPDDLTNIFDSSPFERGRPNAFNGAAISTAQAKFGTTSGLLGGRLEYRHDADMDVSASDFTIETHIYFNALPASVGFIVIKSIAAGVHPFAISIAAGTGIVTAQGWNAAGGALAYSIASGSGLTTGVWYHVALTREGDVFTLWIDGVSEGTDTYSGALYSNSTHPLCFGATNAGTYGTDAHFAETRMTKAARYSAPFAVPDARFTDTPMPLDIIWEEKAAPLSRSWATVVFGGGVFVAGGVNAGGYACATHSLDRGVTWANSFISIPADPVFLGYGFSAKNVAYGNGHFVAIVNAQVRYFSSDGESWGNYKEEDLTKIFTSSSLHFGGGIFVALEANSQYIRTSSDGLLWNKHDLLTTASWSCGAYNGDGVHIVAAHDGRTAISTNWGLDWSFGGTLPFGVAANYMAFGNGMWVVTGLSSTQTVAYSTDNGATWQLSNTFYLNSAQIYQRVRYVQHELRNGTPDNAFVVLDVSGSHTHRSFDGITWFGMTPTSTVQPNYSKDWDTDGEGAFVSVGNSGTPTNVIARGTFQP